MVGKMPPPGLCSFSTDRHRSVEVKTVNQLRISATRHDPKGLDVRELFSPSAEGGVFSLDIPSPETYPAELWIKQSGFRPLLFGTQFGRLFSEELGLVG